MNNLITVFMNYKINRLVEYGVVTYQKDSPFIRSIFGSYFQNYVDNYYYGIFNTIDEVVYNRKNLKLELSGMMEELLYDYQDYEKTMDPEEYEGNRKIIHDLRDIAYELVLIDTLTFKDKDDVENVMNAFFENNKMVAERVGNKKDKLIRLVRETYVMEQKILQYQNTYFTIREKNFLKYDDCVFYELIPNIKSLEVYRKGLIEKVIDNEEFVSERLECLIQTISHMLLINFLEKKETKKIFISLDDSLVSRGSIKEEIYNLLDNPMFQKYVYLAVSYNTYLSQRAAFTEDFHFACVQDFSHINDVFQKIDSIYNEGFSHYLIVNDYKETDKDYFMNYKNEVMKVLLFEEE